LGRPAARRAAPGPRRGAGRGSRPRLGVLGDLALHWRCRERSARAGDAADAAGARDRPARARRRRQHRRDLDRCEAAHARRARGQSRHGRAAGDRVPARVRAAGRGARHRLARHERLRARRADPRGADARRRVARRADRLRPAGGPRPLARGGFPPPPREAGRPAGAAGADRRLGGTGERPRGARRAPVADSRSSLSPAVPSDKMGTAIRGEPVRNRIVGALVALLAAAVASTGGTAAAQEPAPRPNILLIAADDLGFADLGAHGGTVRTPSIDALAARGLLLTRFHTAPLCAPTRAMLLSGNNNHVAGLGRQGNMPGPVIPGLAGYENRLSDRVARLPAVLREAGYHTYMVGKWHLGDRVEHSPWAAGFERSFAMAFGAGNHFNDVGIRPAPSVYFED